ncbi:MAG: hypothetical protein WD206_03375 [Actinomycetota bacterium]
MSAGMTWSKRPAKWLRYTALFEFAIAAFVAAIGLSIPEARTSMLITAGILVLTGIGLFAWGRSASLTYERAQQIRTTGIASRAAIVSMRQTGMSMNDQPQIELELRYDVPGKGTHTTTRKEYVPLMLLGTLTSGTPLPIKVDPTDPTLVAIEWELTRAAATSATAGSPSAAGADAAEPGPMLTLGGGAGVGGIPDAAEIERARTRFRATGIDGTAVLSGCQLTALEVADNKVFQVTMTVDLPGRDPYVVTHMALIPEPHVARMVVGSTLPVKVDRDDPQTVMLDWDRP